MRRILLALLTVMFAVPVYAQFSITPRTDPNRLSTVAHQDSMLRLTVLENKFRDRAKERAERLKLRNQRNYVNFTSSLTLNQNNYEKWAKGGQNTFTGNAAIKFNHKYSRNKFYVDYTLDARLGISSLDGQSRKGTDYLEFSPSAGWDISKHWAYSTSGKLITQFMHGYKYSTNKEGVETKTLTSAFMSPGTINIAVGFTYKNKPKDENIKIQISPVGGNMTTVLNDTLASTGNLLGGKDYAGKKVRNTFVSSAQIDLNYKFAKEKITWGFMVYAYSNYKSNTYLELRNDLKFHVGKLFTINTFVRLVHDQLSDFSKLAGNNADFREPFFQANYQYGLGLTYIFKNKDKKQ